MKIFGSSKVQKLTSHPPGFQSSPSVAEQNLEVSPVRSLAFGSKGWQQGKQEASST